MVKKVRKVRHININNSSLELFLMCPYKFKMQCIDKKIAKTDEDAANFGTAFHSFLEEIIKDPNQDAKQLMMDSYNMFLYDPTSIYNFQNFKSMCIGYVKKYMDANGEDIFYPVAKDPKTGPILELKLEKQISDKFTINGTIDKVGQTDGGEFFLADVKTTKAPYFWKKQNNLKAHVQPQFSHYSYLLSEHGIIPSFTLVDIIGTDPKKRSYERIITERSAAFLTSWFSNLQILLNCILNAIETDTFYQRHSENSCGAFGGCELFNHCFKPEADKNQYVPHEPKGFEIEYY